MLRKALKAGGAEKAPSISFTALFKGTNPERHVAVISLRGGVAMFALFPQSQES